MSKVALIALVLGRLLTSVLDSAAPEPDLEAYHAASRTTLQLRGPVWARANMWR